MTWHNIFIQFTNKILFYTNLKTLECGQTDVLCTSVRQLAWDYLPKRINPQLIGYADACYLYNPHNGLSQICIFGWDWYFSLVPQIIRSLSQLMKQVMNAFGWDRYFNVQIWENCGLSLIKNSLTILHENNATFITHIKLYQMWQNQAYFTKTLLYK